MFNFFEIKARLAHSPGLSMQASNSATVVIEVSDLSVTRDAPILQAINWQVKKGQHWVILGANGSGKTSLLRVLTGYLAPSGGVIRVLGETFGRFDWRELRKRVGLVSSSIRQMIPDHETALETVVSGASATIGFWREMDEQSKARALEILRQAELLALQDRPWRLLSEGERQRVLIGRALMAEPKLLILDEPCAGLDPVARERFLDFLQQLGSHNEEPALVLVTHHVEEIMPVFSHVLVLKNGKVLASGTKDKCMTSEILSEAFGTSVELLRSDDRYWMRLRRA